MQSVQYRNMTDEELLRRAYMQGADPLVKELCERLSKLLDLLNHHDTNRRY